MSPAITTLQLPARLDGPSILALRAGLDRACAGGIVLLRGADAVTFCGGMDLGRLHDFDAPAWLAGMRAYADLLAAIADAPVPVIAVVEGNAFGGGVGIAAASDVVLATPDARFGLPEARYGFHPAIVFAALDLRLAPQKSRLLALQCESVDATAATAMGLVDEVASAVALEALVQRWCRRLSRATSEGVAAIRAHVPHRARLRESLDLGVTATMAALARPEVRAAVAEALA
jgi:enoyl-CoA hydratase/carnithine racemase